MLVKSEIISILNEAFKQSGKLRKANTQLLFNCPFCDRHDGFRKMEVCIDGERLGYSNCWRCHISSKSFGSLLKKLNASQNLRTKLFNLTGEIKTYKRKYNKKIEGQLNLPDEFKPLYVNNNSTEYKNAIYYLKKRNVLLTDIIRYNIGYCETGDYQNHIIIPSYDKNNNLNFFIGRQYYETDGYRYRKPVRDMNIVGFENMIYWEYGEVSLCEGVFDAFAIRRNAIPLFGKYPSKKLQETLITNNIKRVNIILDNDAMEDAIKNCELLLKCGLNIHLVKLNDKDPSVLGFYEITKLIKSSTPYTWEEGLLYKLNNL